MTSLIGDIKYCRINLSKTNYTIGNNWNYIKTPNIRQLNVIYKEYCEYKKFESVPPIFDSLYTNVDNDILGYFSNNELVAFSLIKRYDLINAEAYQFAWNYKDPSLRLGIQSLENECAEYKRRGFKYLYLGLVNEYKKRFDGFEILGKL